MSHLRCVYLRLACLFLLVLSVLAGIFSSPPIVKADTATGPGTVYFPVTGHHVSDPFLATWRRLGGLATFGYPLTEPMIDPETGRTVQYFERNLFEWHPENSGTEYEVLFALLGSGLAAGHTEPAFAHHDAASAPVVGGNITFFPDTGHFLSNGFKSYWESHGGLRIFGYPISEEFQEQGLTVQYFERARFEWHPENAGTEWEILLGRIGADRASTQGVDISPAARQEGVPDYDPALWMPKPVPPRSLSIPVLMYHQFGDGAARYTTPIWRFEQQLDWLQQQGYHFVTLSEVYDYIAGIGNLPERPVALTFDDSPASQWDAVQVLNARGIRGTFFVLSQSALSNWQLQDMAAHGHEIDSHTISHADLTTVSDEHLWHELADSRATLQAITGQPVNFIAFPYGEYNARVIAAAQGAGYRAALAAWGGHWWTPEKWWAEPRIEVSGLLSLNEFVMLVTAQY